MWFSQDKCRILGFDKSNQVCKCKVGKDWTGGSSAEESLVHKLVLSQPGCSIAQAVNVPGCTNKCVASRTQEVTSVLGRAEMSFLCSVLVLGTISARFVAARGEVPQREVTSPSW